MNDYAESVVEEEILSGNMSKAIQIENDYMEIVKQGEKLTAEISILDETKLFWNMKSPELADTAFYVKLKSYLKNLSYLLNSTVSSIVLYAPKYQRIFDQDMSNPYYLSNDRADHYRENTDWIEGLQEIEDKGYHNSIQVRAVKNSYPYVMTVIKQYVNSNGVGVIAVDIDLKKIYQNLSQTLKEDEAIWILDKEERVIVSENKKELYGNRTIYPELSLFEKKEENIEKIEKIDGCTTAYTQKYCEEYEVYIVVASRLENFDARIEGIRMKIIGIAVVFLILASALLGGDVMLAYRPFQKILNVLDMTDSVSEKFADYEGMENEVSQIVNKILETVQKNKTLSNELENRMELLAQTKLQALKSQINPHFLFNTLNVIVMMIDEENPESEAAQMVVELAAILNYSLSDEEMVTVAQEIEHIKRYVDIMRVRYKNKFAIEYEIPSEFMEAKIPKLLLQPLIENAIFHGINEKTVENGGRICVSVKEETVKVEEKEILMLQLKVEDNGNGMSKEKLQELSKMIEQEKISMKHIGVQNTAKRISLLYSNKGSVKIVSKEREGTSIIIIIPMIFEK